MDDEDLTTTEAAALLRVHPDTVRGWAEEGRIKHWVTPGGQLRFRRSDIDEIRQPSYDPVRRAAGE